MYYIFNYRYKIDIKNLDIKYLKLWQIIVNYYNAY